MYTEMYRSLTNKEKEKLRISKGNKSVQNKRQITKERKEEVSMKRR
jgi:hypothetical protein